jgi:hypothetical protein
MTHLAIELPADMAAGLRAVVERAADASYRRIADALVRGPTGEAVVRAVRAKLGPALGPDWFVYNTEGVYKNLEWDVKQILVNWHRAPTMKTGYGPIHTSDPDMLCEALREVAGLDVTHEWNQYGAPIVRVNGFISPEWEAKSKSVYAASFHRVLYRSLHTSLEEKQRKIELLRADLEASEREFARIHSSFEDLHAIIAAYTLSPQTPDAHAAPGDASATPDPVHPAPAAAGHQTN